ncbi:methyltransferase [Flavilitoribacter nigricans DSM 23189 = NBRC 102662]|uniref:Methyltransferase n=2 Tax=Flavilitoribacter TaxID=2762562 RepID=A0A2D0N5Y3_FLAN2|nr:methyltransferase [Flavilitoribacter nigricans DSM 23189 = NBRC 102662]
MNSLVNAIQYYCEQHSGQPDEVLYELERETGLKTLAPQMISGHLQGQLLQLLSQIARPRHILEVGTFTGYATICLARGLAEGGRMDTIEVNAELAYIIRKYLKKAGLKDRVQLHIGDALEIIPRLPGNFDLIFLDAGKQHYQAYYDLLIDRMPSGGLLLADNVLWSGKVLHEKQDADTATLHQFNEMIQADERVDKLMLPLRDGLYVIRKK